MNAHDPHLSVAAVPPSSIELEQALLGAILLNNEAYHQVSGFLTEKHFFEPLHAEIFRVMARAIGLGRKATPKSLAGSLPKELMVGDKTPGQYVAMLAADATSVLNAADFGQQVFELSLQRDLIAEAQNIIGRTGAGFAGITIEEQLEAATDALSAIRSELSATDESTSLIGEAAARMLAEAIDARDGGKVAVPSTGFSDIDRRLAGGYRPGRLMIVAARPGMGKTVWMCASARRVARSGVGVGIFSLEIDPNELSARIVAAELARGSCPLEYRRILTADLDDRERLHAKEGVKRVADYPIDIDHAAGVGMGEIEARARMMKERFRRRGISLGAVMIDYAGLIKPAERYRGSRTAELGEIALAAKTMSKRLDTCVVLLSQLNRAVESRDDKRPQLSDLRESGNLEEHADVVAFLYRNAYYLEASAEYRSGDAETITKVIDQAHDLDVIFAKNRLGPPGVDHLWVDVGLCAVDNAASNYFGGRP